MPFWGLNIVNCHYGSHSLSFSVCLSLSLSFSVLPLTNIYLFLSQFCHLMTHVVLLLERADGSLVSHILRKKKGWLGYWRASAGQTVLQTTYMDESHKYMDSIP